MRLWIGIVGLVAAAATGWLAVHWIGGDRLHRLATPPPAASAKDADEEGPELVAAADVPRVREADAPSTVEEVEAAAAKTQARMDQRLEALPPDVRILAEARRYASGFPIAAGTEPELRQAIDDVLAKTKQEYDDSLQLVNTTRTAVLDRRVAEGRYQKLEKGSGAAPPQRHGAVVNGIRVLPDGTPIHLVVEAGEAPELDEAIQLHFQVQKERANAVAAVIQRAHAKAATKDAAPAGPTDPHGDHDGGPR